MNSPVRSVYVDASGLVKLIIFEQETPALQAYLGSAPAVHSSRIAWVEIVRAVARQQERDARQRAATVLSAIHIVELDEAIAARAAELKPPTLRSLDAIHLASALALGDELAGLVTYDRRLASAARAAGLTVIAPT